MTDKTQELADRFFAISNGYDTTDIEQFGTDDVAFPAIIVKPFVAISSVHMKELIQEFEHCFVVKEGLVLGD